MTAQDVRDMLLRLLDDEPNASLAARSDETVRPRDLTQEELAELRQPGPSLYGFLRPRYSRN